MAARQKDRYRIFEVKPALGGTLITNGSADNATINNYTIKRDWRRDLDQEIRREGHDYFYPNLTLPVGGQPFPSLIVLDTLTFSGGTVTATRLSGQWFQPGETVIITGATDPIYNGSFIVTAVTGNSFQYEVTGAPVSPDPGTGAFAQADEAITLLALARRPNGQTAVIAGSQHRLYRYYALEDGDYISKAAADYPPGTPASQLMYWSESPADYPPGTLPSQLRYIDDNPGYWIVIGSGYSDLGHRWETVSINGYMVFNNGIDLLCTYRVEELSVVPIYELRENGIAMINTISEINGILMGADVSEIQPDQLANWFNTASNPYGIYPFSQYLTRTQFRVIWGTPAEPRRWATIVPGSIAAYTNVLVLDYPVKGFNVGQNLTIVGAGAPHAGGTSDNLTGNVLFSVGNTVIIDSFAQTSVTGALVQTTDSIGSIVGFEDLQDDGSAILKMLPLADQLVIYKDTSIFLGQYLGDPAQPFAFAPRRIQKEQGLYYRHALWLAETPTEMFHIYAGRNAFYRFDLTNQQPMILPKFESCSNIFYDQATLENTERIFAAENGITHEILFVWPVRGSYYPEQILLWDYKWNTISTSSAVITAACTVRKPLTGRASGAEQDWFIMGTAHGAVLIYGKTNEPQGAPDWDNGSQIFFRRDAVPYSQTRNAYASQLKSGLGAFGNDYSEKDARAFLVLMASQSPNTPMTVEIYGAQNANLIPALIATKALGNPSTQNLVPLLSRRFYFQSSITVNGIDDPCRLVGTLWNVAPIDSRSLPRG